MTNAFVALAAVVASLAFVPAAHAEDSPDTRGLYIMATVDFVVDRCPNLEINIDAFHKLFMASGADGEGLHGDDIMVRAQAGADSMHDRGNDADTCEQLWTRLGPKGTTHPGMLSAKP